MNEHKLNTSKKILGLSAFKLKSTLKKATKRNSLFFLVIKILLVFMCIMIPVVAHNVINLLHGVSLQHNGLHQEGRVYLSAAQAIGYCQPMVFFSCISCAVISLNIMNFLRRSLDVNNKKNQPKDIIDSGYVYVIVMTLIISVLLISVMLTYSNVVVQRYEYETKEILQAFIKEYVLMMPIFIFFSGLSLYFELILTECGINY